MSKGEPLHSILLDIGGASHMDTTAAEAIKDWREQRGRAGMHLALIDPSPQITLILQKAGVLDTGSVCTALLVLLSPMTVLPHRVSFALLVFCVCWKHHYTFLPWFHHNSCSCSPCHGLQWFAHCSQLSCFLLILRRLLQRIRQNAA